MELLGGTHSKAKVAKLYHANWEHVSCTETLNLKNGGRFEWCLADPSKLIQYTLQVSPRLQNLYRLALHDKPCSPDKPWRIIIGYDEFTPGKLQFGDQCKKTMCLYFNFVELGRAALAQDATWFIPITVRHDICGEVDGGWSHMLAVFFKRLLWGEAGGLAKAGVTVAIGSNRGETLTIFGKIHQVLSDGDGLAKGYMWRGASSIKPCLKHTNVTKKGSDLSLYCPECNIVEIDCHDPDQFQESTWKDHYSSVCLMMEAHEKYADRAEGMTKELLEQTGKATGMQYHRKGLPYDRELQQAGIDVFEPIRMDWVHTCFQDGCMSKEIHLLLVSHSKANIAGYADLEAFLKKDWKFPRAMWAKGRQLHRIFSAYRTNTDGDHDKLRASASECMGVYALVRHWLETRVEHNEALRAHRASFDAACKTIETLMLIKRKSLRMRDGAKQLRENMSTWLRLHKKCYGIDHIIPKHHWMFDVATQLRKDAEESAKKGEEEGEMQDALTVERLHLVVKPHANRVDNWREWERSILAGVFNDQLNRLTRLRPDCNLELKRNNGLHDRLSEHALSHYFRGIDNAPTMAISMRVLSMHVSVDDIVFLRQAAGVVISCAEEEGEFYVVVHPLDLVRKMSDSAAVWEFQREDLPIRVWKATHIEQASAWMVLSNGKLEVIR